MGGADEARCGVVLASLPPQSFAFGEGHLDPAVAAGNGAFDRDFSGHFPILQRQLKEGGSGMRAGCSASTFILVAERDQYLHPSSPGHRLAHRKGPLNAGNAVRTTGLLIAGRNRRTGQPDPALRLGRTGSVPEIRRRERPAAPSPRRKPFRRSAGRWAIRWNSVHREQKSLGGRSG